MKHYRASMARYFKRIIPGLGGAQLGWIDLHAGLVPHCGQA
jgi:hypothetical protein